MAIQILSPVRSSAYTFNSKNKMAPQSSIIYQKPSSHLTSLPTEILSKIIAHITYPTRKPSTRILMPENVNATPPIEHLTLLPTLLTSKRLHHIALSQVYRAPSLDSLSSLWRFTRQIVEQSSLGKSVRKLDLSSIPSTRHTNSNSHAETQNLLKDVLSRTPLLREVYIGTTLANFVDAEVLEILLCELPFLEVLHLDSCTSILEFEHYLSQKKKISPSITSLSLRNCSSPSIPSSSDPFWNILLQSLPRLQKLNVSNSFVSSAALMNIPSTARLTHLDISFCPNLHASDIVKFLTTHPSITSSIEELNLSQLFGTEGYLFPSEISEVLAHLPVSLRSLDLGDAGVMGEHVPHLQRLRGLEVLRLGGGLGMGEVENLVLGDGVRYAPLTETVTGEEGGEGVKEHNTPLALAVLRCKLRRRINSITPVNPPSTTTNNGLPNLAHLSLVSLSLTSQTKIIESILLSSEHVPKLKVIELSEQAMSWNDGSIAEVVGCVGWQARRDGKRVWIARV